MASLLISWALALVLTPLGIRAAWATGYLDHPEARKLHTSATALLGGVVVFVCAALAWLVATHLPGMPPIPPIPGVFAGAVVALVIGMWDDKFGMRPLIKLTGHTAAVLLLFGDRPLPELGLSGPLDLVVTLVALVGLMNAVNFLDNMNGMVGGLAAIALGTFAVISFQAGATGAAVAQLALGGACLGFLRYNFPRARVFLGDAGSLLLGYSLGASGVLAFQSAPAGWARFSPFFVLGVPAFDLMFVVVNRLREGRKIYEGGRDHSNHRLASVIRCPKRTVLLTWAVGAALSGSGLVVYRLNRPLPTLLLSALWITLFLVAGRRLSSIPVAPTVPLSPGANPGANSGATPEATPAAANPIPRT